MAAFFSLLAQSKPFPKQESLMEQPEMNQSSEDNSASRPVSVPASEMSETQLRPQTCPTCAGAPSANSGAVASPSYVYAIGRIEPRFPRRSVEKEFAQAIGRVETSGLTDRQTFQKVLTQRQNRYLARQLCWVMTIEGLETYILSPRDPAELDLLVEALRPTPRPTDLDCVIGIRGPLVPPEMCNGLIVPILAFDQIYSFDRDALIKAIPKPEKTSAKEFAPAAEELFDRIMQMTSNAGATDEHRALNYLAVRYQAIYTHAAEAFARNASLSAVYVASSRLSGMRKVVDVIFSYTNRSSDVMEKFFCRVDVTEEFPFLVTKMSPYYDR
jgi:cyclic patellamide precursor peptide PatG